MAKAASSFTKKTIAITDQTNHKENIESVAKQHFQQIYGFGFERKAIYDLKRTISFFCKGFAAMVVTITLPETELHFIEKLKPI